MKIRKQYKHAKPTRTAPTIKLLFDKWIRANASRGRVALSDVWQADFVFTKVKDISLENMV